MLTQSTSGLLDMSEAAIGVAIRSCPGVQPRRSYSRLHAIIADSASFANSADRFANNFASDTERGLRVDHVTVWRWVQRYAPEMERRLRSRLKPTNDSWRVDETYVRVKGKWVYLYRA